MPASSFDSARRFEALARLGQALTASQDLPRVLDAIAIAAAELLPSGCSRIWIAEGGKLRLGAQAGVDEASRADAKNELAVGEGLIGHVAFTQAPLIVADVGADSRAVLPSGSGVTASCPSPACRSWSRTRSWGCSR